MKSKINRNALVITLISAFILAAAFAVFGYSAYKNLLSDNIDTSVPAYNNRISDIDFMPSTGELRNYEDFKTVLYSKSNFPFSPYETCALTVKYSEDNYKTEKSAVLGRYTYQDSDIDDCGTMKNPDFEIDSFKFKTLSLDYYEFKLDYPRNLCFIGVNDESNEIVYIYFSNFDLDTIEATFEQFLREDCGWDYW